MRHTHYTENTCASEIQFDLDDGMVTNIVFAGGCNGNLKAIPMLLDGWAAADIIAKLKGNTCGRRPTSCTDQLAVALEKACQADCAQAKAVVS